MKPNQTRQFNETHRIYQETTVNMKQKTYSKTYPSLRYKPVEIGGLFNHYGFYLAYLVITIFCLVGGLIAWANAEAIDRFMSELAKKLFL